MCNALYFYFFGVICAANSMHLCYFMITVCASGWLGNSPPLCFLIFTEPALTHYNI